MTVGFTPEELSRLSELRRELHRHPELSWREAATAERLEGALAWAGATGIARVAGTGLIARIPGRRPGAPTVAIRGDIDALPIQEATSLPFASQVQGVMHACGHDVHAAWTVGAARLLARAPADGDVLIVLQPAEEVAEGALAVLASGALDGVAAIFGGHVDRRYEVGRVVAVEGPVAAAADFFRIELVGAGAHGARPHEAADPIVGAASLVGALQTLVSRRVDPAAPAVVTVGTINGGTADNVIPDRVTLTGTVRAMDAPTRALLREELRHVTEHVAAAHRLRTEVVYGAGPPAVVNPSGPAGWARRAVETVLGKDAGVPLGGINMGGEDFGFYLERMPGCFLRVGAREPGGPWLPAHSPRFEAAEASIFVGAAVLAETARQATSG